MKESIHIKLLGWLEKHPNIPHTYISSKGLDLPSKDIDIVLTDVNNSDIQNLSILLEGFDFIDARNYVEAMPLRNHYLFRSKELDVIIVENSTYEAIKRTMKNLLCLDRSVLLHKPNRIRMFELFFNLYMKPVKEDVL